ncbi:phosphatase PAP2 family protein [Agromyces aerolatus]|uniref:phosphatase PAP2 family protein n=1 Tax=Agromyces sp. LY-1074 TaxID=3074080 RepID=UPI002854F4A8|nr:MULTISPECIES: phosphatase PAP2 family protein [unclassified Agromyces]MDR5698209.1 phosphatase PAP2 family protein [Agromyces sp. LY-1074]MDR5704503.1 phosphatase PAP2 family protein [Agromyces sp. LY-1358]
MTPAHEDDQTTDAPRGTGASTEASVAPRMNATDATDATAEGTSGAHDDVEAPRVDVTPPPAQAERRARVMRRRVPLIAGGSSLVIAALLGWIIVLRIGELIEMDEEWAEEVLTLRGPVGDLFAYGMNALGGGVMGVFIVPIGVAIVLLICRRPWGALYFIVASAASAGVVQLLKHLFGRARPEDIIVVSDFGSFPSGHVANAATIAVALGVIVPRAAVWIAGAAYTVLMAISRTYLGAHWFTDTVGGLLIGAGVALLVWALFAGPLERERIAWTARLAKLNAARAQAHITPPAHPR